MVIDMRDKILQFIKNKGPVLPVQISKEIGSNILMASAHLAELTDTGKLKISTIKVGGSPLYYLAGQEEMLEKFIGGLNDKELKAFNLLKESKILRDREQDPVVRVALRELKDFAMQLFVNYNGTEEIFWKWHMVSDTDAEPLIKKNLHYAEIKPVEQATTKDVVPEQKPAAPSQKESVQEKQEKKIAPDDKIERKTSPEERPEKQQEKKQRKSSPEKTKGDFDGKVKAFFDKNGIVVVSSEILKKNAEIDFIVSVPTPFGNIKCLCRAQSKKKISDSDLSSAFVKGQFLKMTGMMLSDGELTPKAQEMLQNGQISMTFKRI